MDIVSNNYVFVLLAFFLSFCHVDVSLNLISIPMVPMYLLTVGVTHGSGFLVGLEMETRPHMSRRRSSPEMPRLRSSDIVTLPTRWNRHAVFLAEYIVDV